MTTKKTTATQTAVKKERTIQEYLGVALRGVCMGASDIVPGVSGGTIAFIFGIYEELIDSIRTFGRPEFWQAVLKFRVKDVLNMVNWEFLLALGVGILTAVFALSRILEWLLVNQAVYLWSFFFGLIIASIITVGKSIEKWTPPLWGILAIGTLFAYLLVQSVPVDTPESWWFLILSGAVASVALILPGISGSFILLLMGKYQFVVSAVNDRNITVLILVAIGAGIGLISFAQVLSWLFKKYHNQTVALLTGFMIGSLWKIWPWREATEWLTDNAGNFILDSEGHRRIIAESLLLPDVSTSAGITQLLIALVCMIIGFGAIMLIDRVAQQGKKA